MATARKTSVALKKKLSIEDFLLRDVRTVSLNCERFLSPEKISTGSYGVRSAYKVEVPFTEKGEKGGVVKVLMKLRVDGSKVNETNKKNKIDSKRAGEKSFAVNLAIEAFFGIKDRESVPEAEFLPKITDALLAQLHPLAMANVRWYVAEMGFIGFRPTMGFRLDKSKRSKEPPPEFQALTNT